MELIYNVNKLSKVRRDWGREETPICCLSPQNVVAFCSTADLLGGGGRQSSWNRATSAADPKQTAADGEDLSSGPSSIVSCHHVYVCDIDKPWQVYRVTCLADHIVAIEWHLCGYKMLIATEHGLCQVWEMEDQMMNEWKCDQSVDIQEDIITIGWLHQGNRMTFNAEKKENVPYSDKIMRTMFKPSLTHYGRKPVDGWIAVTATGLVCVCLPPALNKDNYVSIENLLSTRSRIQIANIAHNTNGDILLVTSDGNLSSVISCYNISLHLEHGTCKISVRAKPSLFAKCHLDSSLQESPAARITHVQFMHKEVGDVLLVAAGSMNNSHIELWHLTTDIIGLHRVYSQSNADPDSSHCTEKWVYQSSITQSSLPISIATPRFPVVFNSQDTNNTVLFQYIALAYRDGSVKLVNKHTFQAMVTTNLDYGMELSEDGSEKRRRVVAHITSMQQTFTGCALVGMDQYNCMYVMKVVNTRDPLTQVPVIYLVGMLEYLLYSGYDWWDVLASLKPGVIENVIQKLSDNFAKQSSSVQELLFSRFMAIRGSLFRCCSGSQQRAADCHCKLVLHSVSTLFKTVLRPKVSSAQEMNPAEKLTATCSKNHDIDLTKVMKGLNLEKNQQQFVIDMSTLQALQHLIQWVANLTMYLLASLPMAQGYTTFPGSLLLRDQSVLGTLRELLLIIKVWGLMNPACLPHFTTTSSDLDILGQMFKLLTRVWLAVKEGGGVEFDDKLVDDCCLLPSQVLLPPVDQGLFGDTCYQASLFAQPQPVQYNFNERPGHAKKSHANQASFPEGQIFSEQKKDIIRQIYLGVNPAEPVRVCSRCDCMSLRKNVAKSATMMAWELKFTKSCLCGGHWKSDS